MFTRRSYLEFVSLCTKDVFRNYKRAKINDLFKNAIPSLLPATFILDDDNFAFDFVELGRTDVILMTTRDDVMSVGCERIEGVG